MSISDLFDSGFRKRNEDHFAAIVRIAMDDGVISEDERSFLERLARNLDINDADFKQILKNYKTHRINPPTSFERRLERLYDLSRMVYLDDIKEDSEVSLLRKIAVGLGFSAENVKYIVDKALALVSQKVDLDTFTEEMKLMNR